MSRWDAKYRNHKTERNVSLDVSKILEDGKMELLGAYCLGDEEGTDYAWSVFVDALNKRDHEVSPIPQKEKRLQNSQAFEKHNFLCALSVLRLVILATRYTKGDDCIRTIIELDPGQVFVGIAEIRARGRPRSLYLMGWQGGYTLSLTSTFFLHHGPVPLLTLIQRGTLK